MYMNEAFPFTLVNPFLDPFKRRAAGSGPNEPTAPCAAGFGTLANQNALVMAKVFPTGFHDKGGPKTRVHSFSWHSKEQNSFHSGFHVQPNQRLLPPSGSLRVMKFKRGKPAQYQRLHSKQRRSGFMSVQGHGLK
jgi:hypothetical protein